MKKRLILTSLLTLALIIALITTVAGCAGETGLKGSQGEQGIQGEQGERGLVGPQGKIGLQGEPGPKGSTGAKGAAGSTGAKGEQGIQGEEGPRGSSGAGAKGATGATGPKGDKGDPGVCVCISENLQAQIDALEARIAALENPPPKINGVLGVDEWDDFFWFTDNTGFSEWNEYGHPIATTDIGRTFNTYATNDGENLYLAFDIVDDPTDLLGDSLNVNFNVGDLDKIDAGDCSLETNWIGVKEVMWGMCTGDGWGTRVRTNKALEGDTTSGGCTFDNGAEIRWGFTDHRMYEVAIPLELLGVGAGDQVGIVGNIYDGYGSTGSPGLQWNEFPDDFSWDDTSTYLYVTIR